jgi:Uma2 family endonuclease
MNQAVLSTPVRNEPQERFVFDGVDYERFLTLTDAFGPKPRYRIAYDGMRLEIMTISRRHERWKRRLSRLVDQLLLQLDIPAEGGGQTTFRSRLVERGVEPDDCFWIEHVDEIVGVDDWDAELHPPPDLVLEVVVTSAVVDRIEIYSKLGVPELWVFDGTSLVSMHRQPDGKYRESESSLALPFLRPAELLPFLSQTEQHLNETEWMRQFIAWVESQNFPGASHS